MRFSQLLITFCVISNIYQSRYFVFHLVEIALESIRYVCTDSLNYIQQHWNVHQTEQICNQTNTQYNLSDYEFQCPQHRYRTRIIERRPLIIYIEQFLTQDEIEHLLELAKSNFVHSSVAQPDGLSLIKDDYRSSSTAYLNRAQTPIVKCIEQRFARFQGDIDPTRIEPLQVVRYNRYEEFKPHVDWFQHAEQMINGGQRISTFFTYLQANCSMGETEFHNVKFDLNIHTRFCQILKCDPTSIEHGIRFRPIPGNSIFWFNINENGQVDNTSFHAGLPPGENGQKFGLNTWTRERTFEFLLRKIT